MKHSQELLAFARVVVRSAADLAGRMRAEGIANVSTKTTETDVVTVADRAVEQQVIADIRRQRPRDVVLGEEFGELDDRDGAGADDGPAPAGGNGHGPEGRVRWILDPIDGTVNYLYGLPQYAVSLAAEVNGQVVAGVVRNIVTGREWTATLDGGSHVDGRRLTGSAETSLSQALIATGFGYDAERRRSQARVLAALLPQVRDIRRCGAASLDLCMAAEGTVDAYYERGLNPWDHAAGGLIAAEAGLRVTGLAGQLPGPRMLLAAPPALHGPLHDQLVALDASSGP
jgi:myo-inositol-1(or 4)-monophosphatase